MECGVERSFFNAQNFVGYALDMQGDALTMHQPLLKFSDSA
jgi:hypothetical protein